MQLTLRHWFWFVAVSLFLWWIIGMAAARVAEWIA